MGSTITGGTYISNATQIANGIITSSKLVSALQKQWNLIETLTASSVTTKSSSTLTAYDMYLIVWNLQGTTGEVALTFRINGDSGSNYNYRYINSTTTTLTTSATNAIVGSLGPSFKGIGQILLGGKTASTAGGGLLYNCSGNGNSTFGLVGEWSGGNGVQVTSISLSNANAFSGTIEIFGRNID